MPITEAHRRELDERGFVRLEGFIAPERRQRLADRLQALFDAEGDRAGAEFRLEPGARRLANLVDKGAVFVECIVEPVVLEYLGHVLGTRFKLSSLNARSANPRNGESQPLHVDAGALPDERGFWVCNTVWMLDDFTPENGALRAVPGSHRWGRRPQDALGDPRLRHPDEVLVTGRAGDLVICDAPTGSVGKGALGALEAGDTPGISMVLVDGAITVGRSRNTAPAARAAVVLKGAVPGGGGH